MSRCYDPVMFRNCDVSVLRCFDVLMRLTFTNFEYTIVILVVNYTRVLYRSSDCSARSFVFGLVTLRFFYEGRVFVIYCRLDLALSDSAVHRVWWRLDILKLIKFSIP